MKIPDSHDSLLSGDFTTEEILEVIYDLREQMWWGVHEIMHGKSLEWHLARNNHSATANYYIINI